MGNVSLVDLRYSIRGYSEDVCRIKRTNKRELPKLNKMVKVYPRDVRGKETRVVKTGKFVFENERMIFLESNSKAGNIEAFLKTDLMYGIYEYEYI